MVSRQSIDHGFRLPCACTWQCKSLRLWRSLHYFASGQLNHAPFFFFSYSSYLRASMLTMLELRTTIASPSKLRTSMFSQMTFCRLDGMEWDGMVGGGVRRDGRALNTVGSFMGVLLVLLMMLFILFTVETSRITLVLISSRLHRMQQNAAPQHRLFCRPHHQLLAWELAIKTPVVPRPETAAVAESVSGSYSPWIQKLSTCVVFESRTKKAEDSAREPITVDRSTSANTSRRAKGVRDVDGARKQHDTTDRQDTRL